MKVFTILTCITVISSLVSCNSENSRTSSITDRTHVQEIVCRQDGKIAAKILAYLDGNSAQMVWYDYFENTFFGDGYDSPRLDNFSDLLQGHSKTVTFSSVAGNPGEFTKQITISDGNFYITDKNYFYLDYSEKLTNGQTNAGSMQCRLKAPDCYTVQIFATAHKSKADGMVESLRDADMGRSSISKIKVNTGAILYRVRSGNFSTVAEAIDHARTVKNLGFTPSPWVTTCEMEENILERY